MGGRYDKTEEDWTPEPYYPRPYRHEPVPAPRERSGHVRISDAVWAEARADYLAGESAEAVCGRYGMAVSTFRNRAAAEGWRRSDQPDPEPVDLEAETEAGLPDYGEMARHALVRLNRAVLKGRSAEASSWMRLHVRLLALARAEAEAAAPQTPPAPEPAPKPAPRPAAKPTKPPSPQALAMVKARTVQSLVRTAAILDPKDAIGRQVMNKSLEILNRLDALDAPPASTQSDGSDGSDGVSEGAPTEGGRG